MLVVPTRVGGGPTDNGRVVVGRFELRRFGDFDVLGSLLRRRDLSDDRVQDEQAAGRGGDRQFHEQSIHRTDPHSCSLGKSREEYGGHARPPYSYVPALWDR